MNPFSPLLLSWSIAVTGTPGANDVSFSQLSVTQGSTDPCDYLGDGLGGLFSFSYAGSSYSLDDVGIVPNGTPAIPSTSSPSPNPPFFSYPRLAVFICGYFL